MDNRHTDQPANVARGVRHNRSIGQMHRERGNLQMGVTLMSCCNDHRLSGQAEALDHWAATLEIYANDIDAMISRGMYRGKFKLVEQGRRDEQRKIARDMRDDAVKIKSKLER